ncbi:hypothetical protein PUMCH_003282 [Australozyma saopauloensis]|uniref:NDT80 domain-containing protein n=1 Tax=Australozyma saopauloensis TaxID=291208 RepID=A0AAX4HC03_9ASCO|nr:hypothetical protein PUMCH_003282 [[Candida] saopauloensis]
MKEEKIDDLASLFLPDLLTPIGTYNANPNLKTDDNGFLFGIEQSVDAGSTYFPQSFNGYGSDNGFKPGSGNIMMVSQRPSFPSFAANSSFDATMGIMQNNEGHIGSHQPFPNQDYGHSFRIGGSSEVMPPPNRLRPNILPIQSNMGQPGNQYDNILWLLQSELLQTSRPVTMQNEPLLQSSQQHLHYTNQLPPPAEPLLYQANNIVRRKQALAPVIPDLHIDYSPEALLRLLDMNLKVEQSNEHQVTDAFGNPCEVEIKGFLHGRFCTNNYDNYIYQMSSTGAIDEYQTYAPLVISCYRRNFLNIHIVMQASSTDNLSVDGELVEQYRLEIDATAENPDANDSSFSLRDNDNDAKDFSKVGDNLTVETIGKSHTIKSNELSPESFFMVRKLKFNSSTINSLKLNSQTYYCLIVRLVADTASGSKVLQTLTSAPIIVRGRNPSFYNTRKDIVIKPKSPCFKASYGHSHSQIQRFALEEALSEPRPSSREEYYEDSSDTHTQSRNEDAYGENASESEEDSPLEEERDTSNEVYIDQVLESMSNNPGKNYHYFPVLNVYYTPPVNVVYFPHGAHLANAQTDTAEETVEGDSKQKDGNTTKRKKVYFK